MFFFLGPSAVFATDFFLLVPHSSRTSQVVTRRHGRFATAVAVSRPGQRTTITFSITLRYREISRLCARSRAAPRFFFFFYYTRTRVSPEQCDGGSSRARVTSYHGIVRYIIRRTTTSPRTHANGARTYKMYIYVLHVFIILQVDSEELYRCPTPPPPPPPLVVCSIYRCTRGPRRYVTASRAQIKRSCVNVS